MPGDAVTTRADRDHQIALAREAHRRDHIGHARAAGDAGRMAVDRAIPDPAGSVVSGAGRHQQLSAERSAELVGRGRLQATEILGDRWTLLIVREMLGGASGFNELQRGLPGISRSVLTDRMRALERADVIERRTGPKGRTFEYRLTPAGRDLQPVVQAIGEWGATWSFTEPRPEELDPDLLIVWMARHVDRQRLPPNRTVVKFDFRDPKRRYWMVLEPSEVSVCLQHPGFDVDLEVIVDTTTLYCVYLGRAELGGAIRAGQLTMSGPRTLQRGFGHWFTWSAFAPASRSAQERRKAASHLASPHRVRIAEARRGSGRSTS